MASERQGRTRVRGLYSEAMIAGLLDKIERLRADNHILASAVLGWTPDLNAQTPEEVAATRDLIEAAARRAVPKSIPGARVMEIENDAG